MTPETPTVQTLKTPLSSERFGFICTFLFVLALILFFALKAYLSLGTLYAVVIAIHAAGFLSGFISRRIAQGALKDQLKITRHTMILNGIFAAIFVYRLFTL